MTSRRTFIAGAAAVGGALATGGCRTLFGETAFYGPTIRDRIWMWGHHVDTAKRAAACLHAPVREAAFKWPGRAVDQAEGCRLLGIPNNCVIRWCNMPKYPWGDYFEQFKDLKRISFGIHDGGSGTIDEKMRIAFEELQPRYPNLTGCFLDDYFLSHKDKNYVPDIKKLGEISDAVHAHGLRLSVVAYADQVGLRPEFKPHFGLVDEVSFWFWKGSNIPTMSDQIRRCRDFIGPDKDMLLGLYMWDFTTAAPVPADLMRQQLSFAERFLADRTINGLLFHPTFAAALDVPAVNLSKQWIAEHGEKKWGDGQI